MNYRWLTAISIVGILVGVGLFLDGFIFSLWGCFGPDCQGPPFSYYLYVYYIPFAIIGASAVTLIFSLLHKTVDRQGPTERKSHLGRNLTVVAVVLLAVSLFILIDNGTFFSTYGCFGPCGTQPYIWGTSCYSVNKTCTITMTGLTNPTVHDLKVLSCAFVQANSTVNGILSASPSGPHTPVAMQPNTLVSFFCASQGTPLSRQQAAGNVVMSSGQVVEWSGTWQ